MAPGAINRQVVLARRPESGLDGSVFEVRQSPVPRAGDGEVVVRVEWLSVEPSQRMFLVGDNAIGMSVPLGEVVWGYGLGTVVESRNQRHAVGDRVQGWTGWQDYSVGAGHGPVPILGRVAEGLESDVALALGRTGLTAYIGMVDVGRPVAGETVVVTAAAGATGSVAVQLARQAGCRTIGIAGGVEKCRWLREVAGVAETIDRRGEDVAARLAELAPGGVDLCFDNVGGAVLDAVLVNLADHARVVACGAISSGYERVPRPEAALFQYEMISAKRATIQGFMVGDHAPRFREALAHLRELVAGGELQLAVNVVEGLERAPEALAGLFEGRNLGKLLVRL